MKSKDPFPAWRPSQWESQHEACGSDRKERAKAAQWRKGLVLPEKVRESSTRERTGSPGRERKKNVLGQGQSLNKDPTDSSRKAASCPWNRRPRTHQSPDACLSTHSSHTHHLGSVGSSWPEARGELNHRTNVKNDPFSP